MFTSYIKYEEFMNKQDFYEPNELRCPETLMKLN